MSRAEFFLSQERAEICPRATRNIINSLGCRKDEDTYIYVPASRKLWELDLPAAKLIYPRYTVIALRYRRGKPNEITASNSGMFAAGEETRGNKSWLERRGGKRIPNCRWRIRIFRACRRLAHALILIRGIYRQTACEQAECHYAG